MFDRRLKPNQYQRPGICFMVAWISWIGLMCPVPDAMGYSEDDPKSIQLQGTTMGPIEWHVVVPASPGVTTAERLQAEVQSVLNRVDQRMSTYIADSDVSRFNQAPADEWVEVDAEVVSVVARAQEISRQTDGAFDITVAPAVNRWSFGPEEIDRLPDDDEIESLKEVIGWEKLEVRSSPPALKKIVDGLQIDLSAMAKGYAVDQVVARLVEMGVSQAMVEVGGEVRVLGTRSDGQSWRIGIEAPVVGERRIGRVAVLVDAAMATSGDYRNFRIVDGRRMSHTIDPRTCRPVQNDMALSCIVAADCMTADALATAAMVLGVDGSSENSNNAIEICRTMETDGYFVRHDGNDWAEVWTEHFPFAEDSQELVTPQKGGSIWPAFVAAMGIFILAVAAMAIGAIFGNRPIQGSCGGIAIREGEDGSRECGLCQKPVSECPERRQTDSDAVAEPESAG